MAKHVSLLDRISTDVMFTSSMLRSAAQPHQGTKVAVADSEVETEVASEVDVEASEAETVVVSVASPERKKDYN